MRQIGCHDEKAQASRQHPEGQRIQTAQHHMYTKLLALPPPTSLQGTHVPFLNEPHSLIHLHFMLFPRAQMLFYPFFENSNYPQGSAQMSPLQQKQLQPLSQN